MSSSSRFRDFANLIKKRFPDARLVADIAGGKGDLQIELRKLGIKAITFDKRSKKQRRNSIEFRKKYFDSTVKTKFDLLVAMHPDEATDLVISEAKLRRTPFIIVPCCIMPNKYPLPKTSTKCSSYTKWINHLCNVAEQEGFMTQVVTLPFKNKNQAIIGRPK